MPGSISKGNFSTDAILYLFFDSFSDQPVGSSAPRLVNMKSSLLELGLVSSSRVVALLIFLSVQSCFAWVLGPTQRGEYAVCILFATFLPFLFTAGLENAVVYFVASKRMTLAQGISNTVALAVAGSSLAILLGLLLIGSSLSFFDKAATDSFHLAIVVAPISVLAFLLPLLLTAMDEFRWYSLLIVLSATVQLISALVFLNLFSLGVNGALATNIVSGIVTIVGVALIFKLRYRVRLVRPTRNGLREMLGYSARHYIGNLSKVLNAQTGRIVIAMLASRADIAFFAVASTMAIRSMIIPNAAVTILTPKVAGSVEGQGHLIAKYARINLILAAVLMPVIAILAPTIMTTLFSPAFLPAAPLFQLLALGVIVRSSCKIFDSFLLGMNRPGVSSFALAVGLLVNVVVLFVLVPRIALPGAAIAMVAGWLASSVVLTLAFKKYGGMDLREIWRFRKSDFTELLALRRHFTK